MPRIWKYDNEEGGMGMGAGEIPTSPSSIRMVNVCPRCSQEMANCSCTHLNFYSEIGQDDGAEHDEE